MNRPILLLPIAILALSAADPPKVTSAKQPAAPTAPAPTDAQASQDAASDESLIQMRATPYKPALARDPFKSPTEATTEAARPDLVEDIAVKGRILTHGKVLAVVADSHGNIRWLPVGHHFKDGVIASIDDKSVTFHQWDPNTPNTKHFRTIVKTFKREEGKR